MKKIVFWLVVAVCTLVSCSSDDSNDFEMTVDKSELPAWVQTEVDYFIEHSTAIDVFVGKWGKTDMVIINTVYYNTPYVYYKDGNLLDYETTMSFYGNNSNWHLIYSWRPEGYDYGNYDEERMNYWRNRIMEGGL